jgi:hypothetical protein
MLTFDEFNRIIGLQAKYDTEKRYAVERENSRFPIGDCRFSAFNRQSAIGN